MFGGIDQNLDSPEFNIDDFLLNNSIFCTVSFRKFDFLRGGGYKPYMTDGYEDYELWICFVELGLKPYRIDKILFNYRRKHQMSRTDRLMDSGRFRNMKREILVHHFNFYLNNECFIRYLTESCPKRLENLINENEQLKNENEQLNQSNVELKKYWESVYNNLQGSFDEQISKNQKKAKKVRKYKRLLLISYLIFCCILASMFNLTKQ